MQAKQTEYTGREPVTRTVHERPWTADLESRKHAANRALVIEEARDAVSQTDPAQYVDLVTHESHGHPATYLYPSMESLDRDVVISDNGRCSCGGYVTRVRVR